MNYLLFDEVREDLDCQNLASRSMSMSIKDSQASLIEYLLKRIKLFNKFIFLGLGQLLDLSRIRLDAVALLECFGKGHHSLFDNFASFYLLFYRCVEIF